MWGELFVHFTNAPKNTHAGFPKIGMASLPSAILWAEGHTQGCHIWVFPEMVVLQNGWFKMENPITMDDLGVPLFLETPISMSEHSPLESNFFEHMKSFGPRLSLFDDSKSVWFQFLSLQDLNVLRFRFWSRIHDLIANEVGPVFLLAHGSLFKHNSHVFLHPG